MTNMVLLLLAGIAVYFGHCYVFPRRDCRRCKGSGKIRSGTVRRTFYPCPRCSGDGWQLRRGSRLLGKSLH
jgi:DnaJ-class molecular chaperone